MERFARAAFDKIKIDRTFIAEVPSNKLSAAIVRSTLILASSLNIPVLAEGVESEENLAFLWQEGCPQVQGFLFGQPCSRSEIEAVVNPLTPTESLVARRHKEVHEGSVLFEAAATERRIG